MRKLGRVLDALLTEDQRRLYAEFLNVGESGLALEMLVDWLSEDQTALPASSRDEMLRLGHVLGNSERIAGPLEHCPPGGSAAQTPGCS